LKMPRNAAESLLETILPQPIVEIIVAVGRFVYAVLFSRSLDPDSWTAALIAPLVTLLLAYASLVVAFRTVRNTFQLAWFGVKYGALIGAVIAIYSWYVGDADGRGLGGVGRGANAFMQVLDGAAGVAGLGRGGRGGGGGGGGGADLMGTLGQLVGLGGGTALPLLGTILGQLQNQGGNAGARGARAANYNNNNAPRRSERLRRSNNRRARTAAQPAGGSRQRETYTDHPALFQHDPDYFPHAGDDDDYYDDEGGTGHDGADAALRAVKNVLRWLSDTPADDDRRAANRRGAASNPLFRDTAGGSSRRRRRRSSSVLDELD